MDERAAIAAMIGVAIGVFIGAAVDSRAGKTQWRELSAFCAFGSAVELLVVTEGNHSRSEHNVVAAVMTVLVAYWLVVTAAGIRARRRDHP